jgi:hypothetical protein
MTWFLQENKQYVHDYKYQIHGLQLSLNIKLLYINFPRLQRSIFKIFSVKQPY